MKRTIAFLAALMLMLTAFAYADTYTLEEILPSVATFTDEELVQLAAAVDAEQESRQGEQQEPAGLTPIVPEEKVPYTEREDYVEREPIARGAKGEAAQQIQERLVELGFLNGAADGDFGKKSETAVAAFQKANGLEETGVADSITQYVLFSDEALDKTAYDNLPIRTGDGWELLKEYYYKTSWYSYYYIVLKNTSGYDAQISCNVTFYDVNNNIVGVANKSERACENGYTTMWSFSNDMEFDHVLLEVTLSEESWYQAAQSDVDLSADIVGKKAIIKATNNGRKAVEFLEYNILFLNDKGEVVGTGWGYLTDDDNEIKPGATQMRDESCSKKFSSVEVYGLGRVDK